jgi:NAD(P)H-hydrate epimerase
VALANLEDGRLAKLLKGIDVLAVGPGLSTEGEAPEFVHTLVARTSLPIVIDADALNAFAGRSDLLKAASGRSSGAKELRPIVLTPHPGEMARLTGLTVPEVEKDRIGLARSFATEHGVTLVLKGWRTLVAHPDGRIAVNTTGNPAMAKGGSGDILTGVVAAMLAQFPHRVAEAVEAAVFLHGRAADFAVLGGTAGPARDEHTVLATDTVAHLSDAFRSRLTDRDGFTWICGVPREKSDEGLR